MNQCPNLLNGLKFICCDLMGQNSIWLDIRSPKFVVQNLKWVEGGRNITRKKVKGYENIHRSAKGYIKISPKTETDFNRVSRLINDQPLTLPPLWLMGILKNHPLRFSRMVIPVPLYLHNGWKKSTFSLSLLPSPRLQKILDNHLLRCFGIYAIVNRSARHKCRT